MLRKRKEKSVPYIWVGWQQQDWLGFQGLSLNFCAEVIWRILSNSLISPLCAKVNHTTASNSSQLFSCETDCWASVWLWRCSVPVTGPRDDKLPLCQYESWDSSLHSLHQMGLIKLLANEWGLMAPLGILLCLNKQLKINSFLNYSFYHVCFCIFINRVSPLSTFS